MKMGNVKIRVMKDRYSTMTRAISMSTTTVTVAAIVFFVHWISPFGISEHMLTKIKSQFVSKFLATLFGPFGMIHLTKTAYHPQMSKQAQRYDKTIVARL